MAHSKEAHAKMNAMAQFNQGHHEKKMDGLGYSDLKYTSGEMSNPQHLKESTDKLASFVKKHKAQH